MDQANNIALLELYLTLFLGLLFRVSAVSEDASESELFTVVVAFLAAFIFVYPLKGSQLLRWVPRHCTGVIVPPRRGVHYPCTCKQTTSTRRQGGPRTAGARAPLRRVLGSCAARRACC